VSAHDNLSQELFFNVHRGVSVTGTAGLNLRGNVGTHWSVDNAVAKDFAIDNTDREYRKPVILHAEVPISSVETDTKQLDYRSVGGKFAHEKEVPVQEGGKIRITGRTTLRRAKNEDTTKNPYNFSKSRKITYNPPREAKA
jgi:hypothetical protein